MYTLLCSHLKLNTAIFLNEKEDQELDETKTRVLQVVYDDLRIADAMRKATQDIADFQETEDMCIGTSKTGLSDPPCVPPPPSETYRI